MESQQMTGEKLEEFQVVANFLQKEAKEMEQGILPYLNSSNTIQEAHIKYLYDEYNKKIK